MKFRTDGLIIKEQNIGEQDKLVHVLTKSHGVIKAFVRGAKSLKSSKSASTSLLSYSRLTFYKSRDSYIIGDARIIKIFSKLRGDVKKTCLAQYFCELALTICPQEQPAENFLSLTLNSLYLLSEDKRKAELVKPCFEMRIATMAGYMPDLVMCGECGVYAAEEMYFSPRTGKILCASCHGIRADGWVKLSEAAMTALRHTVYSDDDKLFSFSLSDEGLKMLNAASESYIQYRFEKEFKTLNFYKAIT